MRVYWTFVFVFFFIWVIISHLYPEPSWWSIFNSNRATHTPLMEQISIIKVTLIGVLLIGLSYLFHKLKVR